MSKTSGNRVCEEVLGLGRPVAVKLRAAPGSPREADLAHALEVSVAGEPGVAPDDAARFVARWIFQREDAGEDPPECLGNRAAFLWLTLRASGALPELLRRTVGKAYAGTAGTLEPFVDRDDFFELVRWRLWRIPTKQFDSQGVLRPTGLTGFLSTVARRLAIDQIRRFAKRETLPLDDEPGSWGEVSPRDPESQLAIYEEIERAVHIAGAGHPPWLIRGCVAVLTESRDREEVLSEINRERTSAGGSPWTPGAFNTFLYRFRGQLRQVLRSD